MSYYDCDDDQPCVCGDTGWLEGPGDLVIPCTECSSEVDEYDESLEDIEAYLDALVRQAERSGSAEDWAQVALVEAQKNGGPFYL